MHKMIKILFLYDEPRTFILQDLAILKDYYDVVPLKYSGKKDIPLIAWYILITDINFSWFALGYASVAVFFSKLFRKKSVVVAGGWDVASVPEINYGAMQTPKRRRKTKFTLDHADRILAVSESTKKEVLSWSPDSKVAVVYNGINPTLYVPNDQKKKIVLTVGGVSWSTVYKKGLETFVKAAKYMQDTEFVLAGKHFDDAHEYLESISTPNVRFTGYIPSDDLRKLYQDAKVYVQVSAHESFGCSLAEAMLCECVPVATERAALTEVVGDVGYYVDYNDPEGTAQAIKEALSSNKGLDARSRIEKLYPRERRKDKIIEIIEGFSQESL
ncbi:glycosyltransferase family 4 protein [Methanolobus sp. WCC4]|uniref:glycosyltransferase family 4 protein n=1 Tax=Methanolobus sp. WCC4 TaxID=3125784 RepID=UPI0030F6F5F8